MRGGSTTVTTSFSVLLVVVVILACTGHLPVAMILSTLLFVGSLCAPPILRHVSRRTKCRATAASAAFETPDNHNFDACTNDDDDGDNDDEDYKMVLAKLPNARLREYYKTRSIPEFEHPDFGKLAEYTSKGMRNVRNINRVYINNDIKDK